MSRTFILEGLKIHSSATFLGTPAQQPVTAVYAILSAQKGKATKSHIVTKI